MSAQNIAKTNVSDFIECRVCSHLHKFKVFESGVLVRLVHNATSLDENDVEHTTKTLMVFQKQHDGKDLLFFAMIVDEYHFDGDKPRVNLTLLESINYFHPKELRTEVYHEILLGYSQYVKILGYSTIHIWAQPPQQGISYLFNNPPPGMRVPSQERLILWYKSFLEKAQAECIIRKYQTMYEYCNDVGVGMATALIPYFDIDDAISEYGREFLVVHLEEQATLSDPNPQLYSNITNNQVSLITFYKDNMLSFDDIEKAKIATLHLLKHII